MCWVDRWRFTMLFEWNLTSHFKKMSMWSLTYRQRAAKTNWHRYGTKLHHMLPRVLCKTFVDCAKITKYCFAFLHCKSCSMICRWSPTCVSHRGFAGDHIERSPAEQPAQFWVRLASVSCMTKILCHDNVDWRHSVCQQDMASSSVTIIFAPPPGKHSLRTVK